MSRIHDALKRAEQEKANAGPVERAGRPAEATLVEGGPPLPNSPEPSAPAPVSNSALSIDSVNVDLGSLAKCVQHPWTPDQNVMLFVGGQDRMVGAEQFRTLRSHLYLIRKELPLKKLLITSPLPKEGKSFVAGNLAHAFVQQQDRRVLLVDSNLRISGLHSWLGAPITPGLTDFLAGEVDMFSVIQKGPIENLFFIPGGKGVTNPSELIGNGRMKLLLDRVAPLFDWIILDSPPATLVSDAKMLADISDGILMVVKACSTPYDLALKGCQEFPGKRIIGVILNRMKGPSHYVKYQYYHRAIVGGDSEPVKLAKQ